jgi:alkaline phosphatase D
MIPIYKRVAFGSCFMFNDGMNGSIMARVKE